MRGSDPQWTGKALLFLGRLRAWWLIEAFTFVIVSVGLEYAIVTPNLDRAGRDL